jgi:DNA processing protein
MNNMDELRAWLMALRTPGLGPAGLRERLDAAQGDIGRVLIDLQTRPAALGEQARAWLDQPDEARLAADMAWLAEPGHRLLRCTDADFPPQLENIPLPPAALFVVGDASLLLYPQVAIVGARNASAAGLALRARLPVLWRRPGLPLPAAWPTASTAPPTRRRWMPPP